MRVHLVDGTYELFRAHFSPRPGHVAPDGRDLKATVGLVGSMIALLEDAQEQVTHVAVAFDNPVRSFRNDLFDGYKTEAGVPQELLAQFDLAEEAVAALGICVWSMDRWEADDALATGAAKMQGEAEQVRIMTPDKDLGQCLRGDRVVQVDRMRNKVINEEALRERRGIGPASIPDFLALVGDAADGIPGIPGFGEKSASVLLAHYETIEAIPDDPAAWAVPVRGAKRLADNLADRRADALLYKTLATLVEDVPLDLGALPYRGPSAQSWARWCTEVGATRLLDRPRRG
jgi:5'-3' exonuclease